MKVLKEIGLFRIIAVLSAVIFLLDSFLNGIISSQLTIDSKIITKNFELWRFATYPMAYLTTANAFLGFLTFFLIAPRLQNQLNPGVLKFTSLVLLMTYGLILFLINLNTGPGVLSGVEAHAAYILTLYALFNKNEDFRYFKTVRLTKMALPVFIISGWAVLYLVESGIPQSVDVLQKSPLFVAIGILTGVLGYFLLKHELSANNFAFRDIPEFEYKKSEKSMSHAYIYDKHTEQEKVKFLKEEKELELLDDDPEYNEQVLNDILEKISETGYESLNDEERKFLRKYADTI